MDPNLNPFNPGAGVSPPELAGRADVLKQASTALERIKRGRHAKSIMVVGLRGVGKTVVLNEIRRMASGVGYETVMDEAADGIGLKDLLIPMLRRVLLRLDSGERVVESVKKGIRVLRSFLGTVKVSAGGVDISIEVEPERGYADSGDLESDLRDMIVALGEAARETERPVALLIDELQYVSKEELGALIRALHAVSQDALPVIFFGAGLPQLAGQAGDAKSYAERLFDFVPLDALDDIEGRRAVREPVEDEGATIEEDALDEIYQQTRGYPYFLQEWGYSAWNIADTECITRQAAKAATEHAIQKLDQSFFRVRYERTTPVERGYMHALASLGDGAQRSADVAKALGRKIGHLGPVRDSLIKKGMVYSPEHGTIDFTVPLFGHFMLREMGPFNKT